MVLFNRRTGNREEKIESGLPAYLGTLGYDPKETDLGNLFQSMLKRNNPRARTLPEESRSFPDEAPTSQALIDKLSVTKAPQFPLPEDNEAASRFLDAYVASTLIEDPIDPDNLTDLSSQPANAGAAETDPNTASTPFPGANGVRMR
jgi:hypothetical protein